MIVTAGLGFLRKLFTGTFIVATILLPGGCGKDETITPAYGNTVVLDKSAITHGNLDTQICSGSFTQSITETFRIIVLDADGEPVNNAAVTVQVPYSDGSGSGLTPVVMHVVDGDTGAPASGYPYNTRTGDTGTKDITLELDLSCTWGPVDITVFSGGASAKLTVTVS